MFPIFEKLGGEEAAVSIIEAARNLKFSAHTIRSWREKRRIPPINAVILMDEAQKRGLQVEVSDFVAERQRAPRRSRT